MLVLHSRRLRSRNLVSVTRPYTPHIPQRPPDRRFFIQTLGNEFLDLALALPIPPSLPAYSTTIILVTIATRAALLPISIWGKRKSRIIEEVVVPELIKQKPAIIDQALKEMKSSGIRGEKAYLKEVHQKKCLQILHDRRKALFNEHNCHPWKTIVLPPLSQLPIFVAFTMVLSRLSVDPTPFDSESFLTLSTLAHPDPTMTLPILLGIITMANVETSNWLMTATQQEIQKQAEERKAKMIVEGGSKQIEPAKVIKTALRGLSVFRIIIASMTPGSITLYWVTSATFGIFQTWIMDWFDYRRRRRSEIGTTSPPPNPSSQLTNYSANTYEIRSRSHSRQ